MELAQLRYRLPGLAGSSENLSRLGGGIGTRGPGETNWKPTAGTSAPASRSWRRNCGRTRRREQMRSRRKKDGIITAAIVGYTNVGKSTLLNALTDAGVLAENKLFATLDPTARALLLPDGRSVMLIDTVGLVRRLPHNLVEAFKSTLEEAASADVLLCVCDASSPEMDEQIEVTTSLLAELGAADTPMIKVLNKCDLVPGLRPLDRKDTALISAREKTGFEELLSAIMAALEPSQKRLKLLLPYTAAGLLAEIRQEGKVFSEEYTPDGILADALVHIRVLHKVAPYQIS
ncbi:MAG: GTPase HflX [Acutalibacteraceae bacterium]